MSDERVGHLAARLGPLSADRDDPHLNNASFRGCARCGSTTAPLFRTRDFNRRITAAVFTYCRCHLCGTVSIAEHPPNLGEYYAGGERIRSLDQLAHLAARERYRLELVQQFVKNGRCLEIGPNYGIFPYLARTAGFDVDVVEMDEDCCRFLDEVVKVNVVRSSEPERVLAAIGPYDLIVMRHVLEHLPKPWQCLEAAAARLLSGGVLYIAAPNPQALQLRLLGARWPHLDAPRHLQLIPVPTLIDHMRTLGLVPVLLTCHDRGGIDCDRFGWERALMNLSSHPALRLLLRGFGRIVSLAMSPVEGRGLLGSSYTVIFKKGPQRP